VFSRLSEPPFCAALLYRGPKIEVRVEAINFHLATSSPIELHEEPRFRKQEFVFRSKLIWKPAEGGAQSDAKTFFSQLLATLAFQLPDCQRRLF
jgi:hypothetical protein